MKIRYLFIVLFAFSLLGCGVGVSDYDDAVLDGASSLNRGKAQSAYESFNRAVKINPEGVDGFLGRADSLNAMKRYDEALVDYNRAIEIDPQRVHAYVNRGIANAHLGNNKAAIADYEKALELDPKIDNPPGFIKRMFDDAPNTDKGIRRHLEALKRQEQS